VLKNYYVHFKANDKFFITRNAHQFGTPRLGSYPDAVCIGLAIDDSVRQITNGKALNGVNYEIKVTNE